MPIAHRRSVRLALVALLAAAFGLMTTAPAHAAAYRFWGFYQLANGSWDFAQKGPEQTVPKDGAVDGWRFAVSDENGARYPRAVLTFEQVCGTTPAESGKKRVGLVVDFGRPADADQGGTPPAPTAKCAVVGTDATSLDVLRTAGELRVEKGLVCGVDGYPATGCGGAVKTVSAEAAAPDGQVSIAAPTASPTANAAAAPTQAEQPAKAAGNATSAGTWAAYIVVALLVVGLIAYFFVRSRAGARQQR
ncbi:MAG: SCO2322 family protein [Intrasporangium sp.]|uniref:SCO2322 family protein n=1 Tax=Intrasporangium sp. TaxID=1925024 RepID=UPI003F7E4C6D